MGVRDPEVRRFWKNFFGLFRSRVNFVGKQKDDLKNFVPKGHPNTPLLGEFGDTGNALKAGSRKQPGPRYQVRVTFSDRLSEHHRQLGAANECHMQPVPKPRVLFLNPYMIYWTLWAPEKVITNPTVKPNSAHINYSCIIYGNQYVSSYSYLKQRSSFCYLISNDLCDDRSRVITNTQKSFFSSTSVNQFHQVTTCHDILYNPINEPNSRNKQLMYIQKRIRLLLVTFHAIL